VTRKNKLHSRIQVEDIGQTMMICKGPVYKDIPRCTFVTVVVIHVTIKVPSIPSSTTVRVVVEAALPAGPRACSEDDNTLIGEGTTAVSLRAMVFGLGAGACSSGALDERGVSAWTVNTRHGSGVALLEDS
jgi:hypothetical protein